MTASKNAAETQPPAPKPFKEFQRQNVTSVYREYCAKCHGERGEGGGGGTKSLLTEDKFDQKWDRPFFDAIKNGVEEMGMEAYGGSLSDEMIWGQVVHIRELQGRALRQKNGSPKAVNGVYASKHHKFKVEEITRSDLQTPWSLDWLPDGRMLVTNRSGSMVVVKDKSVVGNIENLPASEEVGQGGLMEVAVHPNYAQNGWIYLSLADPAKNGNGVQTKIVRGKIKFNGSGGGTWTDTQTIYESAQEFYSRAGVHFGSKIVFDGKGKIYFSVGERGTNMRAQDTATPYGKVMRVNEDGTIPSDNPIPGNPMWSYGHRNQQGLTLDLEGNLWDTEHGPRGGDELNLVQKGKNYGWPIAPYSINYNDLPMTTPWAGDDKGVVHPVFRWLPSIGASGLETMKGNAFPNWKGDILAGGLVGQNLDRFRMKGGKMVEREELIHGMGRIRDIAIHKDGTIYLALNGPDRIVRIVPG